MSRDSIVIITVGVGIPVLTTLLDRLPFATSALDRLKPYLIHPSVFGTYNVRPLPYLLGNAPTMGQGIYIALFTVTLPLVLMLLFLVGF